MSYVMERRWKLSGSGLTDGKKEICRKSASKLISSSPTTLLHRAPHSQYESLSFAYDQPRGATIAIAYLLLDILYRRIPTRRYSSAKRKRDRRTDPFPNLCDENSRHRLWGVPKLPAGLVVVAGVLLELGIEDFCVAEPVADAAVGRFAFSLEITESLKS